MGRRGKSRLAPMARPHGQSRLPVDNALGTEEAFILEDEPLWYKDAIIDEVHVRGFYDRDGDGVGGFRDLRFPCRCSRGAAPLYRRLRSPYEHYQPCCSRTNRAQASGGRVREASPSDANAPARGLPGPCQRWSAESNHFCQRPAGTGTVTAAGACPKCRTSKTSCSSLQRRIPNSLPSSAP